MDTGSNSHLSWRAGLPLLAALLLAGLLLAGGRLVLAASGSQASAAPPPPEFSLEPSEVRAGTVYTSFDLAIKKSQLPLVFTVGSNNKYFIDVSRTNTYTVNSTVLVEDKLPAGMTWNPVSTVRWDCSLSTSTTVSCFYNQTNPTSFDSLVINVIVNKNIDPVVVNTAKLLTTDADPGNNSSTISTPINSVDLGIQKFVSLSNVQEGQLVTYTMVITNSGPSTATNVIVNDPLPADVTLESWTWSYTGAPGDSASSVTFNQAARQWTIATVKETDTYTLYVGVKPTASAKGKYIINTATVSNDIPDWNAANNSASASFLVGGLQIRKSINLNQSWAYVGQPIAYTIVVTNTSASNANNVVLRDVLPADLTYVSSTPSASYDAGTRTVTYNRGSLGTGPVNGIFTMKLVTRGSSTVTTARTVTNTASVSWGNPTLSLNSNGVPVDLVPAGMLESKKTDGLTTVNPGQSISYTITIQNIGSLAIKAGSVYITDEFYNLDYSSINKGSLDLTEITGMPSNQRQWKLNTGIAVGETITLKLGFKVPSSAIVGTYTVNRVYVTSVDIEDHSLSAPMADDVNTIVAAPDVINTVDFTKSVHPIMANVGETFTFRINIKNNSAVNLTNLRVNDVFPAELDLTSATTNRGTATLNTGTRVVDVSITNLNTGESAQIVILAKVNTSVTTPKILRNRATMTYLPENSKATNLVRFRVLPSGTLPVTGILTIERAGTSALGVLLGGAGLLLVLIGALVLAYSLWLRARHPLHAGRPLALGAALIAAGIFISLAGWGFALVRGSEPQISRLAGPKPPLATHLAVLPSSPGGDPLATPAAGQPAQVTPEPTLDLEPTLPIPTSTEGPTPTPLPTSTPGPTPDLSVFEPTATPASLPVFDVPTPPAVPTLGPNGLPPDSSSVTRMVIPSMGLDTRVMFVPHSDGSWQIGGLKQEIAWMGDTSWPGLGSNTGFAGHVDLVTGAKGPFWNLSSLRSGDRVILYTEKNIYTYEVREQKIVEDYDLSVINATSKPQITLITCTGWDADLRLYVQRLVVFADLLGAQPIQAGQ